MAEQSESAIRESSEYKGDVQVVLGPYNHCVQLRPLDEGTPFESATVEACLDFMFQVAEAEKAKVSIHAPDLGKGPFTVAKLNAFIAEKSPKARLQVGQKDGKPYMGLYLSETSVTNKRRVKVY
jgi:hypothetical protein